MVTQNIRKIDLFGEKIRVVTALDPIKCLAQAKKQKLLLCAPTLELLSNIDTMVFVFVFF